MARGDAAGHPWKYLRREIPHNWYVDSRDPLMGFVSRDEAAILYNVARHFAGCPALEIGCWRGWSTCHLALGGVRLDVLDPVLEDAERRGEIEAMLECAGISDTVRLHSGCSPDAIPALAAQRGEKWSLFFVDGDHESLAPARDVEACLDHAAPDVAFLFHDLASPDVAEALRMLEGSGFNVMLYQTMQIMGIAWRGQVTPVHHLPDPAVAWQLPHHLVGLPVSGVTFQHGPSRLRADLAESTRTVAAQEARIASLEGALARSALRSRLKRLLRLER
jgi:predicted O-methyltransferase YrrM